MPAGRVSTVSSGISIWPKRVDSKDAMGGSLAEEVEERGLDDLGPGLQRGLVDGLGLGERDHRLGHVRVLGLREQALDVDLLVLEMAQLRVEAVGDGADVGVR